MKEIYEIPHVVKKVSVLMEGCILAGSVVTTDTTIRTTGQETVDYDFSSSDFNSSWE